MTARSARPSSIALPKGQPVSFRSTINATQPGVHSAILNLNDPSTPGIEYQTMNTVIVAPNSSTPASNYTVTQAGSIGPEPDRRATSSDVPAGDAGVQGRLRPAAARAGHGAIRFLRWHPFGVTIDSNAA